jgi:hypothetical protein
MGILKNEESSSQHTQFLLASSKRNPMDHATGAGLVGGIRGPSCAARGLAWLLVACWSWMEAAVPRSRGSGN